MKSVPPSTSLRSVAATRRRDDQVVYQLGDQIVLLDLNQDLIGVITRGYSPVVVLEE